jgi:hypothetical protein
VFVNRIVSDPIENWDASDEDDENFDPFFSRGMF